MNKTFVVLRGIPGSGKSTWAKTKYPDAKICSADHYFDTPNGYFFDPSKLSVAHGNCKRAALDALEQGVSTIVLDNTNIKIAWFKEYLEAARRYDYEIEIVRLVVDPVIAFNRNVHGVPLDKIKQFAESLRSSPILEEEEVHHL